MNRTLKNVSKAVGFSRPAAVSSDCHRKVMERGHQTALDQTNVNRSTFKSLKQTGRTVKREIRATNFN
jgi:hypothetical protein